MMDWLDACLATTPGRVFLAAGVYLVVALAIDHALWIFIGAEGNIEKGIRFWAMGAAFTIFDLTKKKTPDPSDETTGLKESVLLNIFVAPFLWAWGVLFIGAGAAALIMTGIEAID